MAITLYTAPNCIRCNIVKKYLADHDVAYSKVDFQADSEIFNQFYRNNRKAIYRNPEGVEFPLFQDEQVIRQGTGEVLAWLLGHGALNDSVTRSDLLHGKISGLYPDRCPDGQEENFVELVRRLADGGLEVVLQTEGRNPALLARLLEIDNVRAICNLVGGPEVTAALFGDAPTPEDLAKTVELVNSKPSGGMRFLAMPLKDGDGWRWPGREDAAAAAKMLADACASHTMPFCITAITPDMGIDLHGLDPMPESELLKFRSAARQFLFKADICK